MQPLQAHGLVEAHLYLKVTPCPDCARGPLEVEPAAAPEDAPAQPPRVRILHARCHHCGARRELAFQLAAAADDRQAWLEPINPTDQPSEIIDLGQWVSLYYLLLEETQRAGQSPEGSRLAFREAQCLDEALKFYSSDDELPPPTAFFTASSRQAFAEHPESFARQRLRDLRSRLPAPRAVPRRAGDDDSQAGKRPWWRFWKRP